MSHLALVKTLSHLQEEQRHIEEVEVEGFGLSVVRGAVTEISGGPSSGKTSFALSLLAKLTADGEVCALVDASGGFDPCTATQAGVKLENLMWIRCGGDVEKAFMSADYLVQAKGFGGDLVRSTKSAQRKTPNGAKNLLVPLSPTNTRNPDDHARNRHRTRNRLGLAWHIRLRTRKNRMVRQR